MCIKIFIKSFQVITWVHSGFVHPTVIRRQSLREIWNDHAQSASQYETKQSAHNLVTWPTCNTEQYSSELCAEGLFSTLFTICGYNINLLQQNAKRMIISTITIMLPQMQWAEALHLNSTIVCTYVCTFAYGLRVFG